MTVTTSQRSLCLLLLASAACAGAGPNAGTAPALAAAPSFDPGRDLVAHYALDGSSRDVGPHGLHGKDEGLAPAVDRFGRPGTATRFDGAASRAVVTHDQRLNFEDRPFSISVWILRDEEVGKKTDILVSKNSHVETRRFGYTLALNQDLKTINLETWHGDPASGLVALSVMPPRGQWFHVVATRTGKKTRIYYNGELHNLQMLPTLGTLDSEGDLILGGSGNYRFTGTLDDLRLYGRALGDDEVRALHALEARAPR